MPYTPTSWVSGTTPVDAPEMNNLETQYTEATNTLEQDQLAGGFVVSGLVCTKDGTTATQLDVTAGVAFVKQSDFAYRRRAPGATNFSTTGNPSTTMYLFLKMDGTWQWGTSNVAPTNGIEVCSVTTDGSSNILVPTDQRPLVPNLWYSLSGAGTQVAGNNNAVIRSAGGGAAGFNIWVGTTDPGSNAVEGDIWIKA